MRIICRLIGCDDHDGDGMVINCCRRCETDVYDKRYIAVTPLKRLRRWLSHVVFGHKCVMCGKRYRRGHDDIVCSEECYKQWLPF